MGFRVLGGVEWSIGGRSLDIGRRKERCLLGLLLLDMGHVVPVARLIDLLWDGEAPAGARGSLQVHVSRLRARLSAARAEAYGFGIVRHGDGYLAQGDPDAVDIHRFHGLVRQAQAAESPRERSRLLTAALAQWRGPVLSDVASGTLRQRLGAGFDEAFLSATAQRIEAELELGRHEGLLAELAALTARHPLHEGLAALRMTALHRVGRRSDALRAFEEMRERLADELGLDPGDALRQAQTRVLRDERRRPQVRTAVRPVPSWLPPCPADFTGRGGELAQLSRMAAAARVAGGGVAVVGAAGAGKTATVMCWAARHKAAFPDGCYFVDLRGHADGPPLAPVEAMREVLRSASAEPDRGRGGAEGPAATLAAYRRTLAGMRALFVLDDAVDVEQVRPLLWAGPGSLVVVTSRNRMGGLVVAGDAAVLGLGPLQPWEATALIARIVGARRAAAEPSAVGRLAALCGQLPLALRIAAAGLVTHPHCTIEDHVTGLEDGGLLDGLAVPGDRRSPVRTALDRSYHRLTPGARSLLRVLGTLPGDSATVPVLAALTGADPGLLARRLDLLFAEHLVDFRGGGRFTVHRLVREYARSAGAAPAPIG
ncbi:BTAD domain-containing putative transcriptional regulator [Streptomyces sp. NPDC001070]